MRKITVMSVMKTRSWFLSRPLLYACVCVCVFMYIHKHDWKCCVDRLSVSFRCYCSLQKRFFSSLYFFSYIVVVSWLLSFTKKYALNCIHQAKSNNVGQMLSFVRWTGDLIFRPKTQKKKEKNHTKCGYLCARPMYNIKLNRELN